MNKRMHHNFPNIPVLIIIMVRLRLSARLKTTSRLFAYEDVVFGFFTGDVLDVP